MPLPLWVLVPSLPCGHLIMSLITGVGTFWEICSLLGLAVAFSSDKNQYSELCRRGTGIGGPPSSVVPKVLGSFLVIKLHSWDTK